MLVRSIYSSDQNLDPADLVLYYSSLERLTRHCPHPTKW